MKTLLFVVLALCLGHAHGQGIGSCAGNRTYATPVPITANGATQLIAPVSSVTTSVFGVSTLIHICAVTIQIVQGPTAATWGLVYGSGGNCSVNRQQLTPQFMGTPNSTQSLSHIYETDTAVRVPAGSGLCLNLSGSPVGAVVYIVYAIF